jgi:hypothetical protein
MRADIQQALRGRTWLLFFGANREKKRLERYLHPDEVVHDIAPCDFGETGGRSILVATDERVMAIKDGWIFRNSQGMGYADIRSVEITTGLIWSKLEFHGEGMEFEVTKMGRWSADHIVQLIRSRIGSRYASWENQRQQMLAQQNGQQNFQNQQFGQQAQNQQFQQQGGFPATGAIPTVGGFVTPGSQFQNHQQGLSNSFPATGSIPVVPQRPQENFPSVPAPTMPKRPVAPVSPQVEEGEFLGLEHFVAPQKPAQPISEIPQRNLLDELKELDGLHRSGALTAEEYASAKRQLLS